MAPLSPGTEPSWRRDLILLAVIFGAILAWRLGSAPLRNPDEGRYAEIPREMVASGDWVTPRLNGVPYFEKPPLVYWAVAACEEVLGPSEWALRLTPALFALAGILTAYAATRRVYGRDAGFWAAVVLGTSLLYLALGELLVLDMAVSVLMSATLFCFILGVREKPGKARRRLFYGLYASAALATLTKGLMGFLVTLSSGNGGACGRSTCRAASSSSSRSRPRGTCSSRDAIPDGRISISSMSTGSGSPTRATGGTSPSGSSSRSSSSGSSPGRGSCGAPCAARWPAAGAAAARMRRPGSLRLGRSSFSCFSASPSQS